ncbi:MAG TPA: bifunctional UDP-3-O-[3-hydroxymyristoyl] N-acetylglucosamine deacetylase/3-hydroxyacyl-ACP dehydratase [Paludibacteraceae bacterium]|jgi:UDP-3-O-[3-hydroxymyristoyl] N-acetylglucosamine deacetylase/3-hydroxyacyl-[acyl-carrier-protein] dehydratase|nr:bifunctional UDP-3-O-[3-hydroxymyristoyl] N-acetylglucosamine deacetylase/3-hydroxyacyl-ACP dehydratase [Paludibacteraceae bacterium]HQC04395.1 bifunctional UDP-3-O-[3-hydroxymyristoyl] N-acetylglucosamine deacetylase/3-hydroxyacyl-ACP dehydratase [Paludibacteraceae bacterium]
MTKQTTLKSSFQLKGKGLHTGLNITLTMNPAPENTGYIIRRIDLEGQPEIPALADYVDRATRGTVLKKGDTVVSTVEHGLAALYAMGIDNCLIEVDAPEFPILDGSAKYYVDKINEVGIKTQNQPKDFFIVREKITYQLPNSPSSITLLPDDTFSVQTLIGYDSPILNNQYAVLDDMSKFATEIAPCRTFVFVHELEPLLKMNLIKGGDLNNSIVIYDRQIPQEELQRIADLMNQPCPNVTSLGYLNTDLLFNNEPARHKMLDIIGDLALIGKPIKGRVIAVHPGHSTNTALAKQIRKELKRQEVSAPLYIPDATPILDTNQIKELLPHRYPFLLVDKVIEINNSYIVSVKNITANEVQFLGHFPQEPVMPGVLIIEAMAQTAGLFVLSTMENTKNLSTYLLKLDNVKFRNKVVPGDVLVMKVFLTTPVRRGVANVKGFAFVGNKIAAEAEMIAQLIDNTNS